MRLYPAPSGGEAAMGVGRGMEEKGVPGSGLCFSGQPGARAGCLQAAVLF